MSEILQLIQHTYPDVSILNPIQIVRPWAGSLFPHLSTGFVFGFYKRHIIKAPLKAEVLFHQWLCYLQVQLKEPILGEGKTPRPKLKKKKTYLNYELLASIFVLVKTSKMLSM